MNTFEDGEIIEGTNGFAVISSSGVIVKSGTKKDGDDYKLVVKDYLLQGIQDNDKNPKWNLTTTTAD